MSAVPVPFPPVVQAFTLAFYGLVISTPLYGIGLAQAAYYYRTYPRDHIYWKCLVALLLVLDTAHVLGLSEGVINAFIRQKLTPVYPWGLKLTSFMTFITSFVVQCAYTARVYFVSDRNKLLAFSVFLFAFAQFVGGMGTGYELTIGLSIFATQTRRTKTYGGVHLAGSVACDLLISLALVLNLNKSRSGFRKTENLIDKLIIYSISIGIITSILALATMLLWFILPDDFRFAIFHFIISKFYINSFLATLNSRSSLRKDLAGNASTFDDVNSTSTGIRNSGRFE